MVFGTLTLVVAFWYSKGARPDQAVFAVPNAPVHASRRAGVPASVRQCS